MTKNDFEPFWDTLTCGADVVLKYRGRKYHTQGWYLPETNQHFMCLDDLSREYDENEELYIWTKTSDTMEKNAEAFLDAPIFEGRSYREVEAELEWSDFD